MKKSLGGQPLSTTMPAVITAALGLMSTYDSAIARQTVEAPAAFGPAQIERNHSHIVLAAAIHDVIRAANELETSFHKAAKSAVNSDLREIVGPEKVGEVAQLLVSLRGIEVGLKRAPVPDELAELHQDVRRSIARARSWVSVVNDLLCQAYSLPEVVESEADGDSLRALAEYSTGRLVKMANA